MMKRFCALLVFWPLLACLVALAGLVSLVRGCERFLVVVSDLAAPLVLSLAEVADAGDDLPH